MYCRALMMEAARVSETSVNNDFTLQYILEDKSELRSCLSFPFRVFGNYRMCQKISAERNIFI
jgi:hypothetical protein